MRLLLIALGSAVMTFGAIANAFIQKSQFYPAVVYITKSNPSMAVRPFNLKLIFLSLYQILLYIITFYLVFINCRSDY